MDEFTDLTVDIEGNRAEARGRLRRAMERESQRFRRRRFTARATAAGVALFMILTVAPKGPNLDIQPLLGLADAVEQLPRVHAGEIDIWYSTVDRVELIKVDPELVGGAQLEFLLPSTSEVWHRIGASERRRTSYGEPRFLSPEDARTFWSADLMSYYPIDRIVDTESSLGALGYLGAVMEEPPDDLYAVLRRQVAGLGDRRVEEVEMLQLSARLMQTYGGDPAVRSAVLRVIADIPGINVAASADAIEVWFDYVDGDRPLRLSYAFDAETAYLLSESLATLATRSEPSSYLERADYEPLQPVSGFFGS